MSNTFELNPSLLLFVGTLFGVEYLRSRSRQKHYRDSYWQERKGRK